MAITPRPDSGCFHAPHDVSDIATSGLAFVGFCGSDSRPAAETGRVR